MVKFKPLCVISNKSSLTTWVSVKEMTEDRVLTDGKELLTMPIEYVFAFERLGCVIDNGSHGVLHSALC